MNRPTLAFTIVLACAVAVRVFLVFAGGQYYWPDERRYRLSQRAAEAIVAIDVTATVDVLCQPEHPLFVAIGVLPALVEQYHGASSRIPALFFAMFSVASIWLIREIALALGAARWEAVLAAALLASATTWTYYSRHLLPYDLSMTLALAALWMAVRVRNSVGRGIGVGVLCGGAFLAYNGSWAMVAYVLLASVWLSGHEARSVLRDAALASLGFAGPLLLLFIGSALAGRPLLSQSIAFASTVTQGSFSEGWSLPFEFLWHAEHGLALIWLGSLMAVATRLRHIALRVRLAMAGTLFIYLALVLASGVLHVFVVYGRTARQIVPFLCLLTAHELFRLFARADRRWAAAGLCALVLNVGFNLRTPLTQVFPDRFKTMAVARAGTDWPLSFAYADHIYPTPEAIDLSEADVLEAAPHPLQFWPYQYEGFTPEERRLLRSTDIRMRVFASRER